jgi:hypothetical protein
MFALQQVLNRFGQRKRWDKIQKRLRGRPKIGDGAKVLAVSVERGLLKEADAFAKRHHLKRSQMVAQGLRLVMLSVLPSTKVASAR